MTCEVKGRPAWCRDESVAVQRLIVAHRLTQLQFKALRDFAGQEAGTRRRLQHSTAQALRSRGLGEITGKQLNRTISQEHPKAEFVINETGKALVDAIGPDPDPGFTIERVSTNLTKVTITRPGRYELRGGDDR